ncbi:MAG: hypothetical protein NTW03_01150 [Verrucomicrobia bacterium]|nr:hypothetical protein [Verrucomicrobiota bacterium]
MNASKPRVSVLRVRQGRAGLLLVAVGWPLHWLLPGVQSVYLFFPLWLGYILMVLHPDGGRAGFHTRGQFHADSVRNEGG